MMLPSVLFGGEKKKLHPLNPCRFLKNRFLLQLMISWITHNTVQMSTDSSSCQSQKKQPWQDFRDDAQPRHYS